MTKQEAMRFAYRAIAQLLDAEIPNGSEWMLTDARGGPLSELDVSRVELAVKAIAQRFREKGSK